MPPSPRETWRATAAAPHSNASGAAAARPSTRQSRPTSDRRAATSKTSIPLARQSRHDNHANAATPDSYPDCRSLPIQIAALQGRYFSSGEPSFWHFVVLAVPQRQAFVPSLFAKLGLQPVYVRPPWNEIASDDINIVSVHRLVGTSREALEAMHGGYVVHWRDRYDYALVVNADIPDREGPMAMPPQMQLVAEDGF